MIRAALLMALLATPAAAEDRAMLGFALGDLEKPTETPVLRAAAAACILGDGQAEAIAAPLVEAGWTRQDDDEMGVVTLYPSGGSVGVNLYDGGLICEVASEVWGTETGLSAVQILSASAGLRLDSLQSEDGCMAMQLTDQISVTLTSTGQDPVCFSQTTSSLRFTYANAN
jgi:hypothetical protein